MFFYYYLYVLFLSFFLIISGKLLIHYINKNKIAIFENEEFGLFGLILIGFFALLLNFFQPLNTFTGLVIIGSILLLYYALYSRQLNFIKIVKSSFIISIISILLICYSTVNDPDAYLYHLPYTQILNENKIIVGIANIHFRFAHVSILQYINAFSNTISFENKGSIIPAALICSYFFLFLIKEILKSLKKKKIKITNIFILSIFIFISLRFNRYSDYGNDHTASIYYFYFAVLFFKFIDTKDKFLILIMFLVSCFVLLQKIFFIIPILFSSYLTLRYFRLKIFNRNNFFSLFFLFLFLVKNVLVSGCIIYPVQTLCFEKLPWYSNDNKYQISAKKISIESESWAKSWNTQKNKIEHEEYIRQFKWLSNWSHNHLPIIFNKIITFLISLFLLFLLSKKLKNYYKTNSLIYIFFIFNFIGLGLWFVTFPIFRYGVPYISLALIFILLQCLKDRFINTKIILGFLIFSTSVFGLKNGHRIVKSIGNQEILPFVNVLNAKYETKQIADLKIYYSDKYLCGYNFSPCTSYPENLKHISSKNKFNYQIIYLLKI